MEELKAVEERHKGDVISFLGDLGDTLVDADGTVLATYKLAAGRKTLDQKALQKEYPEIYQNYIRAAEPSRRFLLK